MTMLTVMFSVFSLILYLRVSSVAVFGPFSSAGAGQLRTFIVSGLAGLGMNPKLMLFNSWR